MAGNKQGHGEHEVRPPDAPRPKGDRPIGYEVRDVNVWAVGKFAIGLVLLCIFAVVVLLGYFKFLETSAGPIAPPARDVRPQPRLETAPILELKAMRDAEDKVLNSYGWVDQPKGQVRIPIAQAIDLLAQRGLPARPQNGVQSASDASVPAESGLGPIMQQVGGPLVGVSK
jgi:hypothetical protein